MPCSASAARFHTSRSSHSAVGRISQHFRPCRPRPRGPRWGSCRGPEPWPRRRPRRHGRGPMGSDSKILRTAVRFPTIAFYGRMNGTDNSAQTPVSGDEDYEGGPLHARELDVPPAFTAIVAHGVSRAVMPGRTNSHTLSVPSLRPLLQSNRYRVLCKARGLRGRDGSHQRSGDRHRRKGDRPSQMAADPRRRRARRAGSCLG